MKTTVFRPVCASGVVKFMQLSRGMDVFLDVYGRLDSASGSGSVVSATMLRNEYHLKSKPAINPSLPYTPSSNLSQDWWFNAVSEADSEINIFLKQEDGKVFLCADSFVVKMIEVRTFEEVPAPVIAMFGEPYNTIKTVRGDGCLRPERTWTIHELQQA